MQIGIDSFAAAYTETSLSAVPADRLSELLEQIAHADQAEPGMAVHVRVEPDS